MTTHATDMSLSFIQDIDPPVGDETDERLMWQLRHGQSSAGEQLVFRYHEPLLRYLTRLTGQSQTADDLLQQTWLSVLEHAEKFDATSAAGGFKAWVFRIATNKANDLWRSRGRERAARAELLHRPADLSPEASEALLIEETDHQLRVAIARLPDAQRQVLLLRYYSGLKFAEIADVLGCPLNTALGRMHKALQKLREMVEATDPKTPAIESAKS